MREAWPIIIEAKKVRAELAKLVRHERSKGQAHLLVSREVFGSFVMLHGDKALWFERIDARRSRYAPTRSP